MWRISAVPTYVWWLLVLPCALVAVTAALRRTYVWRSTFLFSLVAVVLGAMGSYYQVFVMGHFDRKFQYAPEVAFEIDLFGDAIMALLGLLLFGGSLAFLTHKKFRPNALGEYVSAFLGGLYVIVPQLLAASIQNATSWVFQAWLVIFPIIAARMALRSRRDAASGSPPISGHG